MRFTASRCPKSTFHPKIYIYRSYVASQVQVQSQGTVERNHLANVFLFVVSTQAPICPSSVARPAHADSLLCIPLNFCLEWNTLSASCRSPAKPECNHKPYICQLLIDPFLFQFPGSGISQICYKLHQPTHVRIVAGGPPAEKACCCRGRHDAVWGVSCDPSDWNS